MVSIAIVGGGAAGIGAAWGLAKAGYPVTIFETECQLGGHCLAADVPLPDGGRVSVDLGVSDFNRATFTHVGTLFDELGLKYRPINQDASFMRPDGSTVWYTASGNTQFIQGLVDEARFRQEIARFRLECLEVLDDPTFRDFTLEMYLDTRGYSLEFRQLYLYPRAQGSFPMPDLEPARYQIRGLVAFWRIHGIAGAGPADRNVLVDGMHSYGRAFADWLAAHGGEIKLGAEVVGVARRPGGARIRYVDADGRNQTSVFDNVVFAVRSNQVTPLLEDASVEERQAFEGFLWQRARIVLHCDPRLMPNRREAWGAYNYVVGENGVPEIRPTITFYPNKLAGFPPHVPDFFLTMNPFREPAPESVLHNQFFIHPAAGASTDLACASVEQMQGRRNTWYCGSYLTRPWVHEQALASGVQIADRLHHRLLVQRGPEESQHVDDFLRSIPLFQGLDSSVLSDVQMVSSVFSVEAGEVLFRQNDASNGAYLIARGGMQVAERAPGDDTVALAEIGPGSIVGELSLLDDGRRSATVRAKQATTGYFVSRRRFEALRRGSRPAAFEVVDRIRVEVARRARAVAAAIAAEPVVEATAFGLQAPEGVSPHNETADVFSSADRITDFLASLLTFRDFSADELGTLLAMCDRVNAARGDILGKIGASPDFLLIVMRGALRGSVDRGGKLEQLSIYGPGRFVGLLPLIDGGPTYEHLDVRESAIVLRAPRRNFELLRKGYSEVAYKLFDQVNVQLASELRRLNRHLGRLRCNRRFNEHQMAAHV